MVSPDNELLVFLGKDGYMPLVSNKVQPNTPHSNSAELTVLLFVVVLLLLLLLLLFTRPSSG